MCTIHTCLLGQALSVSCLETLSGLLVSLPSAFTSVVKHYFFLKEIISSFHLTTSLTCLAFFRDSWGWGSGLPWWSLCLPAPLHPPCSAARWAWGGAEYAGLLLLRSSAHLVASMEAFLLRIHLTHYRSFYSSTVFSAKPFLPPADSSTCPHHVPTPLGMPSQDINYHLAVLSIYCLVCLCSIFPDCKQAEVRDLLIHCSVLTPCTALSAK